jgi:uncharacterized protein
MASREVRDAIHGLITLSDAEWQVIDSPAFQRLRGVGQLAMTHLVYPGARHSRFEHCIGACHVAGRLASVLGLKNAQDVRLAALCHDLGHGPFSHVSEMVYEQRTGREHIHEQISAAIVRHHQPIRHALGDERSEWIAELLEGSGHGRRRSVERDIVAGPADIDKLDYLLRDSHFCGVNYGRFDLDKLIESARALPSLDESYLGFHEDGIFAVEEMLLARYHMHRQVYGHKTRIGTDKMLVRAMNLGVEEKLLPEKIFAPKEKLTASFVNDYLEWDDAKVIMTLLGGSKSSKSKAVMLSLISRHLVKRVARITYEDLTDLLGLPLAGQAIDPQGLDELLAEAEETVAKAAGVDPMWVFLHWEDLKSPISSRHSFRIAGTQVIIQRDNGRVDTLGLASEVFRDTELAGRRAVSVYVRPKPGTTFDAAAAEKVKNAALDALRVIAVNSASV